MKKTILFSLACLAGSAVCSQTLTAEEQRFAVATRPFYDAAREAGKTLHIQVLVDQSKVGSPVYVDMKGGECYMRIATRENENHRILMGMQTDENAREAARRVMVAHEYAHCLMGWEGIEMTGQKAEAVADLFSLAWIANNDPRRYRAAYAFVQKVRCEIRGKKDEDHNTCRWIEAFDPNKSVTGDEYRMAKSAVLN